MTQKVGLITYIKIKAKALFKKVVGPLSTSVNNSATIKQTRNGYSVKQTSYGNGSSNININGTRNKVKNGTKYYLDDKEIKPGDPGYEEFVKEMDDFELEMKDFEKEMQQFGREMGKMGREMGVSMREAAENLRKNKF